MVDYVGLKNTASELLREFGQLVTFNRRNVTAFNNGTGAETLGAATTFTGYGAGFQYRRAEIDGTVVQYGDVKLTVEAMTTVPIIGDTVTYGSIVYRAMNVDALSPGGVVLRYKIQLRV